MNWWRRFLRREEFESRLDKELQFHIAEETQKNIKAGMTEAEARRIALAAFGSADIVKDEVRELWGWATIEGVVQDVRYAVRQVRKSRSFTVVAVLTLGVAIGAVTTIFTEINAVFVKPLPVNDPGQFRMLVWTSTNRSFAGRAFQTKLWDQRVARGEKIQWVSYPAFLALRDNTTAFSSVGCWWAGAAGTLTPAGKFDVALVSGDFFETLGITAVLGRTISREDDWPTANTRVAVITHNLWQREFGKDPSVLDRTLVIRGAPFQVIGVLPDGFAGLDPVSPRDVFVPYAIQKSLVTQAAFPPNSWTACRLLVRMKREVPEEQARAEAELLLRRAILAQSPAQAYEMPAVSLVDASKGEASLRNATSQSFTLLIVTAAIVLLIACANIAGLLLSRGRQRQQEIATRLAIGAARARVFRQVLIESVLIAGAGGILGILLSYAMTPMLPVLLRNLGQVQASAAIPAGLGRLALSVTPDWRV
jgi:predicted permease